MRGFVAPCLPTKSLQPPSGEAWLHRSSTAFGLLPARFSTRDSTRIAPSVVQSISESQIYLTVAARSQSNPTLHGTINPLQMGTRGLS